MTKRKYVRNSHPLLETSSSLWEPKPKTQEGVRVVLLGVLGGGFGSTPVLSSVLGASYTHPLTFKWTKIKSS